VVGVRSRAIPSFTFSALLRQPLMIGGLCLSLSACAAAEKMPAESAVPVSSTPAQADTPASAIFSENAWRSLRSTQHGISLSLPDAASWRLLKDKSWLAVAHRGTDSTLLVKHWGQGKLVDRKDCENQALLWKTALVRPAAAFVSEQPVQWPSGYQGHQWLYAHETASGGIEGRILIYSANIRDCVAFQFTTRARGPHAANVVATRLSQVTERLLPTLAIHSIEQRVLRARD
jgi:hypothetical protein